MWQIGLTWYSMSWKWSRNSVLRVTNPMSPPHPSFHLWDFCCWSWLQSFPVELWSILCMQTNDSHLNPSIYIYMYNVLPQGDTSFLDFAAWRHVMFWFHWLILGNSFTWKLSRRIVSISSKQQIRQGFGKTYWIPCLPFLAKTLNLGSLATACFVASSAHLEVFLLITLGKLDASIKSLAHWAVWKLYSKILDDI